jgi:hypothetical protein
MKTETSAKIVAYILSQGMASPSEIASKFSISNQAVHAQLRKLVSSGKLKKVGTPPQTVYALTSTLRVFPVLDADLEELIEREFSFLSPTGEFQKGLQAFKGWVSAKKLDRDFIPLAVAFCKMWREVYGLVKVTPIDTTKRLRTILPDLALDSAFITDFYALPQFGKTRLGNLVHIVKTAFRSEHLQEIAKSIHDDLSSLIRKLNIDTVIFYPHSIPRKSQFLPALRKELGLSLPEINVRKVFHSNIPIAQKSLSKVEERIENAQKTVFVQPFFFKPKNVLIIDDAIGSGATVNELAKILKKNYEVQQCHAYAVVGSYKGFDVISAV